LKTVSDPPVGGTLRGGAGPGGNGIGGGSTDEIGLPGATVGNEEETGAGEELGRTSMGRNLSGLGASTVPGGRSETRKRPQNTKATRPQTRSPTSTRAPAPSLLHPRSLPDWNSQTAIAVAAIAITNLTP
jgi:hypothetical protein